jgi:hypothetical protein
MLREGSQVLTLSAGDGKWRPDLRALSTKLTLWRLEMMLALPSPLWFIFSYLLGYPSTALPSPDTIDRSHHRECCGIHQIEELINSSLKQKRELKVLSIIYSKLTESSSGPTPLMKELKDAMGSSQSVAEALYWSVRLLGVMSIILVFYFLIIH